jgi:hypothetical protein
VSTKLKYILQLISEAENPSAAPIAAYPIAAPQSQGQEFNVATDFTNFERTIASYTENAKNTFQAKLFNLTGNKQIYLRASKGYGQPIKDYTINVKNVSIDFYYDRYVVVFKDDNDKEYFLEPGYKIKILGQAVQTPKKAKKKKDPSANTSVPAQKPSQYNPISGAATNKNPIPATAAPSKPIVPKKR